MKLRNTRIDRSGGWIRLTAEVEHKGSVLEPYFAFPQAFESFVVDSPDPFVPALLVPCLEQGEPLQIVPPMSGLLLSRIDHIQNIFLLWFPGFRHVVFSATARDDKDIVRGHGIGTCFSGGVDSFYTLLKSGNANSMPPPTHLLHFKGIEQPLSSSRDTDAVLTSLESVARETGTTLIPGESNIRELFPTLDYERHYNGAAVASAALALAGGLRGVFIPSSVSFDQLVPWGTHPLLDPMWTTEQMEFVHHGCEARRSDKIEALLHQPLAMNNLRVCLRNNSGPLNCGRCRKCIRTMLALEFLGVLSQSTRFPRQLPDEAPRIFRNDYADFQKEILDLAERTGRRPELRRRLYNLCRRDRLRKALRDLVAETPILANLLPMLRSLRAGLHASFALDLATAYLI